MASAACLFCAGAGVALRLDDSAAEQGPFCFVGADGNALSFFVASGGGGVGLAVGAVGGASGGSFRRCAFDAGERFCGGCAGY